MALRGARVNLRDMQSVDATHRWVDESSNRSGHPGDGDGQLLPRARPSACDHPGSSLTVPDREVSVRDVARVFFGAVVRKNSIQHHAASDIYCLARQEPVSIGRDSRRGASTTADTLEQLRFMRSRSSAEFSRGRHLLLRGGQLAKLSEET